EDRLEARPEPDRTLGQERDALRLPLLEIGPVALFPGAGSDGAERRRERARHQRDEHARGGTSRSDCAWVHFTLTVMRRPPVATRSRSRPISRIGASSRTDESALSRGLLKTLKTDNGSSGRRSLLTMAEGARRSTRRKSVWFLRWRPTSRSRSSRSLACAAWRSMTRRSRLSIAEPPPTKICTSPGGVSSGRVTSKETTRSRPRNGVRTALTLNGSPARTSPFAVCSEVRLATCDGGRISIFVSAARTTVSSNGLLQRSPMRLPTSLAAWMCTGCDGLVPE